MCEDCLLSICQRCELVNRSAQPQRSPTFLRFFPSSEAETAPDQHVRSRTASSYLLSLWRCRDRLLVLLWAQACVCAHLALQKMRLSDDVWIGKNVPSSQDTGRLKWDSILRSKKGMAQLARCRVYIVALVSIFVAHLRNCKCIYVIAFTQHPQKVIQLLVFSCGYDALCLSVLLWGLKEANLLYSLYSIYTHKKIHGRVCTLTHMLSMWWQQTWLPVCTADIFQGIVAGRHLSFCRRRPPPIGFSQHSADQ